MSQGCETTKPLPPSIVTVDKEVPLPKEARDACNVHRDDGSLRGYIDQLEKALTRCQYEIDVRLEK